jgi:hypothetical protein
MSYELAQLTIPKPEGFWPATIVGWITFVGFLGSAAWIVFKTGRWSSQLDNFKDDCTANLNAFGGRVTKVEMGQEHEEGRVDALEVQMSRTQGQYEALIALLGEAKESVNAFRQGMAASSDKIERKIDDLRREQNDTKLTLSERLKAVETILEHQS